MQECNKSVHSKACKIHEWKQIIMCKEFESSLVACWYLRNKAVVQVSNTIGAIIWKGSEIAKYYSVYY